jgi:hypothetical protein
VIFRLKKESPLSLKFMLRKIAVRTLLVLLALLLIGAIYIASLFWRVTSAEPDWTGTLTLDGLLEPVRVLRNEQGVPHISQLTEASRQAEPASHRQA